VQGDSGRSSSATQATPACARHGRRQEVSEPIGLGRSSHCERSRWEAPSRGKLTSARPLARDILAGRALKGALPSAAQGHDRKVVVTRPAALAGDRWRGHAGFWWSVVVLAGSDRLQKSTGGAWPSESLGRRVPVSSGKLDEAGSSPPARECRSGEGAPEAGSSVAKPRDRWWAPSKRRIARVVRSGASVEERRSGSGRSSSLT
jgi:hypothetical protein